MNGDDNDNGNDIYAKQHTFEKRELSSNRTAKRFNSLMK